MNVTGVVLRGEPRAFHITSDPQTFLAGDREAQDELARYQAAELAHQDVNIRFGRLNHLDKSEPTWTHLSAQADVHVIRRLMRGWPLDCRTLSVR